MRVRIAVGISQTQLEDEIGWELDNFLESEAKALSEYPVDFLKDLCERLGVGWMEALPSSVDPGQGEKGPRAENVRLG